MTMSDEDRRYTDLPNLNWWDFYRDHGGKMPDRRWDDEELFWVDELAKAEVHHEESADFALQIDELASSRKRAREQEAWISEKVKKCAHESAKIGARLASGESSEELHDLALTWMAMLNASVEFLDDHRRRWRLPEGGE